MWAAADLPLPPGPEWIETQWQLARTMAPGAGQRVLLVLDEVQKVSGCGGQAREAAKIAKGRQYSATEYVCSVIE